LSCLFNSFDPYFKQPFGAVRAGQTVRLSLCIPEELGYVDPHLVLKKEGKFDVPVYYRMNFDGQTPRQNHFSVEVPLNDPGLYFYYFDLYTDFRRIVRGPDNCGVISWQDGESWQITVYEQDFETPESIKGKVFYQIFPDRFCEGVENKPMPFADRIYQADKHAEPFWQPNEVGGHLNEDYFGGDLKGIQQKLPYLHEMGVDFIYLNPIFEAHSNHRYNTADYLNVDPLLGTNEDFEALCTAAKKYGIGIVLDGVFSHTGSDSRYFNREGRYGEGGAYRDPNSPYRCWYDFGPQHGGKKDLRHLNREDEQVLHRRIQIVFQDPYSSLNPSFTIYQSLADPLRHFGVVNKTNQRALIADILEAVNMRPEYMDRYPHEFSGGQRQRIGIARALLVHPEMVICDEAVSALDVSIQAQVLNLLMRLKEELKLTYIFITHNLSVVEYISDRIAVMYLGRIVELASTEQIFENTMHPYTEALLSAIPVVDPDNKRSRIVLEGDVPNPVHPPEGCHFHPRCKNCMDICMHKKPELKRHMINGEEHFCACHLYDQIPAGGSDD